MRKYNRLITSLFFIIFLVGIFSAKSYAEEPYLDEINDYTITISVREDATLDIRYDVEWHVLSDKNGSEPVSWALIGIPNKYADTISPISSNIKSAKYTSENGDGVRIDFTKKYYKGEVFRFSFTVHQTHMVKLENEYLQYSFTAGWFESIPVKKITIKWRNVNVAMQSGDSAPFRESEDHQYLITEKRNLAPGEHFSMAIRLYKEKYYPNADEQYVERSTGRDDLKFWICVLVVVIILWFIFASLDGYSGGFGGGYYSSGCACASSCASSCAGCACAGGGRAGCSLKDLYRLPDYDHYKKKG